MHSDGLSLEKKIFFGAVVFSVSMLALIGFAAYRFGITVPGCVTGVAPFQTASLTQKADKHYELHMVARMWSFEPQRIVIPTGTTLDIFLASADVNHGFQIEGTNVNLMAVPGVINYASMRFDHAGDYPIVCHEYCGVGHQDMHAVLHVGDDVEKAQMDSITSAPAAVEATALAADINEKLVEQGRAIYSQKTCIACHALSEAKMIGPSFKGLYGSKVTLSDGSVVTADEAYLKESILLPQKKIVKGFENVPMPQLPLNDDEIAAVIELIKSLK